MSLTLKHWNQVSVVVLLLVIVVLVGRWWRSPRLPMNLTTQQYNRILEICQKFDEQKWTEGQTVSSVEKSWENVQKFMNFIAQSRLPTDFYKGMTVFFNQKQKADLNRVFTTFLRQDENGCSKGTSKNVDVFIEFLSSFED